MRRASVADSHITAQREQIAALPLGERVRLALELGERSLELYCAANGLERGRARRAIERRRQARRRPSRCLEALLA